MLSVALTKPPVLHCRALRCQQREHHAFIHVIANPAKHECSKDSQFMSANRECTVKSDGV